MTLETFSKAKELYAQIEDTVERRKAFLHWVDSVPKDEQNIVLHRHNASYVVFLPDFCEVERPALNERYLQFLVSKEEQLRKEVEAL